MAHGAALLFDLVARDGASPAFLKVAGAADKAAASTLRAQRNVAGSSALMARSGAKLTKAVTLPLLAITAVGAKMAIEHQKQQTLLRTAAGETEVNMRQIAGGIKKVSSDTATSLHQLDEGMYVIAKAAKSRGWTGAEQLNILRAAAQGAKSENVDLSVATDALTTTMVDFHAKAGDAVKMENQLIKASGLAKTSYGLFSESLSNVTPIAAAAGLSFAEVGGAVATMTQHGVTAQRATDNLRNLIFNLTGQNNVASQAMQQLGINTVDLARNLGKRGLTGTLAIVDNAMKAHTKNGMVTVDIHKAAALATGSLNTMIGSMTGKLKGQSQGLKSGAVGIKEYQMYAKSLGGTAGASALQFLGLYKNALGFSNQLKSGKGTVSTSVQQYQKMLGGMTGAAVAMQIAGKYAGDNVKNVDAVAEAAGHAGKNVHGWELTQKTISYKLQDASNKAALFATALGEKALPVLGKMADAGSAAFKWVDGLGSTQKQLLGWSLGIAVAVGPALSIIGRLGRAGSGFATFAGASETAATRVGLSMQRIGTAVGGLALAYGGTQTKGTGGAVMGALGGGLTGAAIGSFFGPVGTAIGGISGAVLGLGAHYLTAGDDAKKGSDKAKVALAEQKSAASDLLGILEGVSGAYNDQYKQSIAHKLAETGALGVAQKAGVKPGAVLDSVIGKTGSRGQAQLRSQIENAEAAGKISFKQGDKLLSQLQLLQPAAASAEAKLQAEAKELGHNILTANQLGTSLKTLRGAFANTGTSLDTSTAAGLRNTEIVRENVNAINANAASQLAHGKSAKSVAESYQSQIGALEKNLHVMGFQDAEVSKLVQSYGKIPKSVATRLAQLGIRPADIVAIANKYNLIPKFKGTTVAVNDQASPVISGIAAGIAALQGKTVDLIVRKYNVEAATSGSAASKDAAAKNKSMHGGRASGGGAPEGYFAVGEEGPEIAHKRGSRVDILSNPQSKAFIRRTGMMFPGFAKGTGGGITHSGKDWIFGGTRYASERAALNAQSRAGKSKKKADQSALSSSVSGGISGIGQAYSAPFSLTDVGVSRMAGTLRSAVSKLNDAIGKGLSKKSAASFRGQIKNMVVLANRQLGALRVKIRTSDIRALKAGVKSSVDDARTALSQLYTDMATSGASRTMQAVVKNAGGRLIYLRATLDKATDKLATIKDYASTIGDTLRGAFDPTKSGSVADLVAGLSGATGDNNRYTTELSGLLNKAKGNASLTGFINQLAASGNTTTLDSLAGASGSELLQVSKAVAGYNSSVTAGSNAASVGKYGITPAQQQKNVDALNARIARQTTAIGQLVALLPALRFDLDGKPIDAKVNAGVKKQIDRLTHQLQKG